MENIGGIWGWGGGGGGGKVLTLGSVCFRILNEIFIVEEFGPSECSMIGYFITWQIFQPVSGSYLHEHL